MTEYELADYTASMMGNFLSALTIYFSVVTAYVVAAFIAGTRLSKVQLAIVNTCYFIAAGTLGLLSVLIFRRFYAFASQVGSPGDANQAFDFTLPLAVLVLMVFIGSLAFMWSVRKGQVA